MAWAAGGKRPKPERGAASTVRELPATRAVCRRMERIDAEREVGNRTRRGHLRHLAVLAVLLALCAPILAASSTASATRPNLVYIMADDLCWGDLSCYGARGHRTPALDRLAAEGVRFTDAYAIAPVCSPTRVGLMTGRYPARTRAGLWEPLTGGAREATEGLAPDPPTLPLLLKRAGYHTALVGKWHLGWQPAYQPAQHGFDFSFGPLGGATDYVSHVSGGPGGAARRTPLRNAGPQHPGDAHDLYQNGNEIHRDGYLTDLFTEEAVNFLKGAKPPFFLSVQYTAPHWPWQRRGDPPYPTGRSWLRDGGSPAVYADMMRALDEGIGRILATLEKLGYGQTTLVIFTSDNGGDDAFGQRGSFRGRKLQLWEGGIRVPAIVRWPGSVRAAVTEQVVTTLDWTATMLAAAEVSSAGPLDGVNLLPFLKDKVPPQERTIYWRTDQYHRHRAVRAGRWKYLRIEPLGAVDRDVAGEYLFDLSRDPGETHNLKASEAETFDRLKALYEQWDAGMLRPLPPGS